MRMDESDNQDTSPLVVTNKAGQSFVVDGIQARELPNGAILAVDTGRIVANPNGGKSAITTANNSDIRSKMFERRLQGHLAAGRGLALGTGSAEELEAVEKMTATMAEMAMDPSRGRVAVEAYRAGLAAAGFGGLDQRRDDGSDRPAVSIQLDQSAVDGLIALVQAWREQDNDG